MLSRQQKGFHFNSPNKNSSNEKYSFLTKTCSSSALRQGTFQKSEDLEEAEEQKTKYSKLLKQKDLKIIHLNERLKAAEQELSIYKNASTSLQNDLHFFKSKIQEEFYRNICMQSELEILNSTIKNVVVKMLPIFQGNNQSMHSIAKHLEQLQGNNCSEQQGIQVSKKLLSSLEFQIQQLSKSFYLLKKQPQTQKSLMRSADLKIQYYKKADEIEKDKLRAHINQLINHYQTKMVDTQDYRQQIINLRNQREYIKELLLSTQKEKNTFVNEIYQIARRQYTIDFERMNKPEVVKLCIALLAKIKDLQTDRQRLQKQLKAVEQDQKTKYQNMLRQVKRIQKLSQKKVSIKRMQSLPFN